MSEDPMGDPNNPNLYSYARNNPILVIDPTGLTTYTEKELQGQYDELSNEEKQRKTAAYALLEGLGLGGLAEALGITQYTTISFSDWAREQGYSSVAGDNNVTYYYQNRSWDSGGDVITRDGISYIHHDDSYTLVQLPSQQGRQATTHSFAHPFDPYGVLDSGLVCPEAARAARELVFIYHIVDRNNALFIFEGYRSPERQQELYNQGRTTPGPIVTYSLPYHGFHSYGLAFDIVFQNSAGGPSWRSNAPWQQLGAIGQEVGFEWGGTWTRIRDYPHFQMPGDFGSWRDAYNIYNYAIEHGLSREEALEWLWEAWRRGFSTLEEYLNYLRRR